MNYAEIYECDSLNGDGFRTVLFVTGCSHKCDGCYNKSTWNPRNGTEFTRDTQRTLFEYVNKPYIKGLTLSGGDPMHPSNAPTILELVKDFKKVFPHKDIWLWTGYRFHEIPENAKPILCYIDVIVDGKYIKELKTDKKFRGSDNQVIFYKKDGLWLHEDLL